MVDNVTELRATANETATTANNAAESADKAASLADNNPTPENLRAAEDAQELADVAATNAQMASDNLATATNILSAAADAANEDVSTTLRASSTAQTNADAAASNATDSGTVVDDRVSNLSDSDTSTNDINENVADGTYTGVTLAAVDVDSGNNITYSLEDGVPFRVESDGRVVVDGDNAINFENQDSYNFIATATSSDGTTSTQSVTVDVHNVNEAVIATNDLLNDGDIEVSNHASVNVGNEDMGFTDAFTISQTITSTGDGGIIFNNENAYEIAQFSDGSIRYALRADNGSGWTWNDTGYDLPFNEEHNVTFTFDGDSNSVKLYVDGDEVASSTRNVPDILMVYPDHDLLFGERGANNQPFEGTIDDIQIYNESLDATQVATIADGGVINGNSLVAHYDFNGANPLTDLSGNGHDATLKNGATLVEGEDGVGIVEDTAVTIDAATLLANDTDIDGDTVTITDVAATADTHGTVSLDSDGNILFTPDKNYNGDASFTYTVSDGHGETSTATVSVNVDSVNDAITLVEDTDTTANAVNENVADGTPVGIILNATDADGDAVTYTVEDGVPFRVEADGTVVVDGDNVIDFETAQSYTFNVTATSADGTSSTTSMNVDVNDIQEDITAQAPTVEMEIGDSVAHISQVVDTDAMDEQGITHNDDGTYTHTAYEDTAKLMKTETIEVGKAENIRLDDAPEHGTIEVKGSDGEWTTMEIGQEYKADSEVRFTPDESAVEGTKDIKIGTFGEHEGQKSFTEHADISDWGEVSADGKSVVTTDGGLIVTTTVIQNGSEQELGAYNGSGNSLGAGIGDTDSGGLSRGETMVVKMEGEDVNQVSFTLDGLGGYFDANSSHATEVKITAFDKNGDEIDTQGGYRESGQYADDYSFTTNVPVDHFEITSTGSDGNYVIQNMTLSHTIVDDVTFTAIANDGTELSLQSDINIEQGMQTTEVTSLVPASDETMSKDVRVVDTDAMATKGAILVDGHWVVENGVEEVEPPMKDVTDGYEYPVDISAALSDVDGSESLSVTITGVPEGATLSEGVDNGDGTWTISVGDDETSVSEQITMIVPNDADNFTLGINATSTESSTGDTTTVSASDTVELPVIEVVDNVASAPTLDMSIGEATVITSDSDSVIHADTPETASTPNLVDATNEGDAGSGYVKLQTSNDNDTVIAGDNYDAVDLKNGDDSLQIGDADSGYTKINAGNGDNVIQAGNEWDEVVSGNGDDNLTVGDGSVKINTANGEDNINVGDAGAGYATIDAGGDNDDVIAGNEWDKISLGSGDDKLQAGDGSLSIDLGTGDNSATVGNAGSGYATITSSNGDNTIVAGDDWDKVALGSGDDTVQLGDGTLTINTGSGDDTVVAGNAGSGYASIDAGNGNDNIVVGDNFEKINLGSGDDTLNVGKADSGYVTIDGGSGDDNITADSGWDKIDGGSGNDTVTFKGDASEWTVGERWGQTIVTNNATGEITEVRNVENIQFGGQDAQTTSGSATSYEYVVNFNAGLTDTDGSESLSSITLNNLPVGASISDMTPNADGTYTIAVDENGDATVTITSDTELSNTALNNISSSITSTETNGGDTHTSMAHTNLDESADASLSVDLSNSDNQTVSGSEGNDTIHIDANDFKNSKTDEKDSDKKDSHDDDKEKDSDEKDSHDEQDTNDASDFSDGDAFIDGGDGLDGLVFEDSMNIDFGKISDNIDNIDQISLGEGDQNITSLSIEDVLDMTDSDNTLRIDGDSSDHIDLNTTGEDAEWTLGDFKTDAETGATYQEVTGVEDDKTVTLEINTEIQIDQN